MSNTHRGGHLVYVLAPGAPTVEEAQKPPSAVSILNPPPGGASTHQLWALWDNDSSAVYWGIESGGEMITWRIDSLPPPIKLPYPAISKASSLVFPLTWLTMKSRKVSFTLITGLRTLIEPCGT